MSTRRTGRPRNLIDGAWEASMVELAARVVEAVEEQERMHKRVLRSINPAAIAPSPQHSRRVYGRAGAQARGRRR